MGWLEDKQAMIDRTGAKLRGPKPKAKAKPKATKKAPAKKKTATSKAKK